MGKGSSDSRADLPNDGRTAGRSTGAALRSDRDCLAARGIDTPTAGVIMAPGTDRVDSRTSKSSGLWGEQLTTGEEGVGTLSAPGTEEGGEGHLGVGAVGRARTATDLAGGDEVAEAALGSVVVGWDVDLADEGQELAEILGDPLGEGALWSGRVRQPGVGEGEQARIEAAGGGR